MPAPSETLVRGAAGAGAVVPAAVKDPFGNVLLLLDRTTDKTSQGTHGPAAVVEDAKAGRCCSRGSSLSAARPEVLASLYEKTGRTADDLPYTPHFESLYKGYVEQYGQNPPTRQEVWRTC